VWHGALSLGGPIVRQQATDRGTQAEREDRLELRGPATLREPQLELDTTLG
jgi:hypothetical protein